ncbi:beta-propeller fold lactonase family protein [uncultured Draconibacterium sp.]|uniref:beta-propeller fold lactonase family protein n=1 Tax=uncultured Draconibacterium sp. TaxID=1573823 RepID=UPI00321743E2
MKRQKLFVLAGLVVVLGLLVYFPGRKLARAHVNYMTAAEDHPLLCLNCHLYKKSDGIIYKLVNKDYLSPYNTAVSNDGTQLYVVAQDANELLVTDIEKKQILQHIPVDNHPHSIVLTNDGNIAYVSNQWADNVSVVDLANGTVTDTLETGNGPSGITLSKDEKFLFVVNTFSSDLTVIDLNKKKEIKRLPAAFDPAGIAVSPDGGKVYVSGRRGNMVPYGEPLVTEVIEYDAQKQRVKNVIGVGSAYLMENISFTPSGDLALLSLIRPKNLVPMVQVERGWMMNHGIGIIEQGENGRVIQLLLDEPNAYYSDPYDVVVTPDGKKAFVSSSGVNTISVIDLEEIRTILKEYTREQLDYFANDLAFSRKYVVKRIPTGACPKGMSISKDGSRLYVAEQLEDRIAVIDVDLLEPLTTIDLGGPEKITVARKGRRLFVNAGGTFQHQYSCYTCHPDYHEDGLVYNMAGKDMGRNVTNTQSLREINGTAPFKWNGKNQTVYKQDGMRFSTVLTRTEAFCYPDLDALTSFILTGIKNPPNLMYNKTGELTASQKRGKEIFERSVDGNGKEIPENGRCVTCHPAPFYTNFKLADVGTLAESDDSIQFDTPHLNNIFASPPYLHDGRAQTLEEIWTLYGGEDEHGVVNDMTKMELNDLINYLKSLRSASYELQKEKALNASL